MGVVFNLSTPIKPPPDKPPSFSTFHLVLKKDAETWWPIACRPCSGEHWGRLVPSRFTLLHTVSSFQRCDLCSVLQRERQVWRKRKGRGSWKWESWGRVWSGAQAHNGPTMAFKSMKTPVSSNAMEEKGRGCVEGFRCLHLGVFCELLWDSFFRETLGHVINPFADDFQLENFIWIENKEFLRSFDPASTG